MYMKIVAPSKLVIVSMAAVCISVLSALSASAAIDISASDTVATAAEPTPVVPPSDFYAVTVAPSVIRGNTPVPEPGTMFAGIGVLTYLIFKSGRRSSRR
jgi:hypothetical protein